MIDATISRARNAIWRVWAAPAHQRPAEPASGGRPLPAAGPAPMLPASPSSRRRAPELPARAPRRAISWHQPSLDDRLNRGCGAGYEEHGADRLHEPLLRKPAGEARAEERARDRGRAAGEHESVVGRGRGQVAEESGGSDADADGEVRADSAARRLADEPEERGHAKRAEDQADEAAEEADHGAGDDRGKDVWALARASRSRP